MSECPNCGCSCGGITADPVVLKKDIEALKAWLNNHINATGSGPSGPPKPPKEDK